MIDNLKLSELIDSFKRGSVDKRKINTIINNYREYPQYVIKYITVIYPDQTADALIKYIVTTTERRCELIDCILTSYSVKLCDIPFMKDFVCQDRCKCYSRDCWRYIYNQFIDLLTVKPDFFITSFNVYNSLSILVSKTDVLDEKLFLFVKDLAKFPKNWKYVIKFIKDTELYSTDYGDLIFIMRDLILENDSLEEKCQNKSITEFQSRVMLGSVLHRYNDMQKNMSKITGNIYISDIEGAKNVAILKNKAIQYIITITKKSVFRISGIEYTQIMIDDIDTVNFIDATIDTVDKVVDYVQDNKMVLVHCYKGLSRSVCFVILVLIRTGLSFEDAYKIVLDGRVKIDPNPGFVTQIKQYAYRNQHNRLLSNDLSDR